MAVYRVEKNKYFTVMSNHHLRNKNLSLKARGLLGTMLSNRDDWVYSLSHLADQCKEGISTVRSGLVELEEAGYVVRKQRRDNSGKFVDVEYIIYENPIFESPISENRISDKPMSEDKTVINTKEIITNDNKYHSNLIPEDSELDYDDLFPAEDDGKDEMDIDSYDFWLKRIHQQIEYESLEVSYADDIKMVDEMVEIIIETLLSDKQMDFINRSNYRISLV